MSAEWKPGDVVNLDGTGVPHRLMCVGTRWVNQFGSYLDAAPSHDRLRPLVVIDPEDGDAVQRVLDVLVEQWNVPNTAAALGVVAAALRTPPKPDEPLRVGAAVLDDATTVWVRVEDGIGGEPSWSSANSHDCMWRDLDAVKVLSEGVTP